MTKILHVMTLGLVMTTTTAMAEERENPATMPAPSIEHASWFNALYGNAGYTRAINDDADHLGGVTLDDTPDDSGFAGSLGAVFAIDWGLVKPYADYALLSHDDRDFQIVSAGIRHDWSRKNGIMPWLSAGAGTAQMDWDKYPVSNVQDSAESGRSFAFTAQAGMEWMFSTRFGLDLRARYDMYDISTTIVDANRVTQIDDKSSISILAGFVFRQPVRDGDEDRDGVPDSADKCPGTELLVPVDSAGCPLPEFDFDLEFEFAGFKIRNMINKPAFPVIPFLQHNPDYHVRISGHTDNAGSMEFNQTLSEQRANEARNFLIENGIAAERIEAVGLGETSPVESNDTEYGRQKNRRINAYFFVPARKGGDMQ